MRLTVELMADEAVALHRLRAELSPLPIEEAAAFAIREFLIARGYLDPSGDMETAGEA